MSAKCNFCLHNGSKNVLQFINVPQEVKVMIFWYLTLFTLVRKKQFSP
jgi:hypothetical protein